MRLLFAGTPDFAATSLAALLDSPHQLLGVYTQPDRKAGRGRKLRPSPVKQLAIEHRLPVFQPITLKDPDAQLHLAGLRADLMVVVAYGLLLPQAVLDAPRFGCVNVHASLLPRWRGAAPIQHAILAGDRQTGVSIMQMDAGLDTGPVLQQVATPIGPADTGAGLHDRLAALGADALIDTLQAIDDGRARAVLQTDALATYAAKLDKQQAWLDWTRPAVELDRQVRAFNSWPVAQTRFGGDTLRVWQATPEDDRPSASPGTVLHCATDGLVVACGEGALRITRLQRPGGKPLAVGDWLNAGKRQLQPGDRLTD